MRPGQQTLNEFELAIIARMAVTEPALAPLIDGIHVLSREHTGVGSYTNFLSVPALATQELGERQLGLDALLVLPRLTQGMGAMLCCSGGYPKFLETFSHGEPWDGTYDGFRLEVL